jgi:hypothetical protein
MSINTTAPTGDGSAHTTRRPFGHLFADARRRTLLRVLAASDGVVELDRLTDRVVAAEGGDGAGPPDRFDRTLVSLYRCHLPALVEADLVELHEDDGVFVEGDADRIAGLL